MKYNIYNIHDILLIAVSIDVSFGAEIEAHLSNFFIEKNVTNIDTADIIINSFDTFVFDEFDSKIIFDDYVFNNNFIIRNSVGFASNILAEKHIYYFSKLFLPINLIIQLALLKKGYSFIHCAAFIFEGKSFLLPAFGGVGKTSILSHFAAKGAKIYGDDLCIIGDGKMFSYPQDMSIYDYHCKIFSILPKYVHYYFLKRKIILKILSPFNLFGSKIKKIVNVFMARFFGECLNVPLINVFGNNCIATSSSIDYFIKLNKKADSIPVIMNLNKIKKNELAKFCTSVVINEWNNYFNTLLLIDACSGFNESFSLEIFFKKTNEIILQNINNSDTYEIEIDSKLNPDLVNTNFNNILSNL
jgi:hypothetical protein